MKYIDADKLIAEIKFAKSVYDNPKRVIHGVADAFRQDGRAAMCDDILKKIASLQQEQQEGNLEYWLEHFGMPKENIDNCITQIAQGYGACRYLEGIQHGAEAVNELAKQDQPDVDLEKEIKNYLATKCAGDDEPSVSEIAHHFYELGLNTRKEETK